LSRAQAAANPRVLSEPTVEEAPFAEALVQAADARDDLVVLSADLSKYTDLVPFMERFPSRFFQLGMAEANMMGVAGGLAKTGLRPVAVTYGVFATRRSYDQVAMALATGPTPSTIVAFLPGITTPFRATHQAIDDLALMRALPGMTVIDPLDATELRAAFLGTLDSDGPVYLRGLRGRVDRLLDPDVYRFRTGQVHPLRGGESGVGLVGTGIGTAWALEAAQALAEAGLEVGVLHVPTLKPLDAESVVEWCSRRSAVFSIENHSIVGGLGSALAEALAEGGAPTRLRRLGVPDRWADAGSLSHIRARLGLDAEGLAATISAEVDR
jgi:transketolase